MSTREPLLELLFGAIRSSEDTWFFHGVASVPAEMVTTAVNDLGMHRWSPIAFATDIDALSTLYNVIPGRLPRLFEELLLSYRWLRVDIHEVTLLGNPPGPGLSGFQQEMMRDPHLYPTLLSNRLVEFAKPPGGGYDPICFDLKRTKAGDCPIVRIDHESVLIDRRATVVNEVAPNFRALIARVAKAG